MSWYLANKDGVIGQFASISGLKALREASELYEPLKDFFEVGATKSIAACIEDLEHIQTQDHDADVKDTAHGLAALMKGQTIVSITQGFGPAKSAKAKSTKVAESLKHRKHARQLRPIRAIAKTVLARYFRAQKRALVKQIGPHLRILADRQRITEADKEAKDAVSAALPDGTLLPIALTGGMSADYGAALSSALNAGYDTLASDEGAAKELSVDVVEEYLRDHSLAKLSGEINGTSVDRLRNALADAYEAGGDYEDLVQAVTDEFADFAGPRAELIAQTEMNSAYNTGRKQLGLDLGFNEKSWATDGPAPCPECVGNTLDGWIGMDEPFSSGDDMPTAHPGCYCSLDVRLNADA